MIGSVPFPLVAGVAAGVLCCIVSCAYFRCRKKKYAPLDGPRAQRSSLGMTFRMSGPGGYVSTSQTSFASGTGSFHELGK